MIVSKLFDGKDHDINAFEVSEGSLMIVIAVILSGAPLALIVTSLDHAPGPKML